MPFNRDTAITVQTSNSRDSNGNQIFENMMNDKESGEPFNNLERDSDPNLNQEIEA